jgi:hypothetical protein
MSHEIQEQLEHAEHASHDAGAGRLPQWIGITVALVGVLMALCSAQVGEARTELVTTMVEENGAKAKHTAVANKYRNLQALLQQLHAAMPDLAYLKKKNDEIKSLEADVQSPEGKAHLKAGRLQAEKILNTVTPTAADIDRFLKLLEHTREEAESAKHWSESFHDAIKVHENTASRFELATLAAEIAIVIASVGLLLSRQRMFARGALYIAIALGVLSLSVAAFTEITNSRALASAEEKIHASEHHYVTMNHDDQDQAEDKKLEEDIIKEMGELKKLTAES